ncbi:hypothetical protein DMZ48_06970 [Robertkochia solimangrovi]|nr:hypothetical protein DMZ48_06970 [Robertkochia solimangrovi]
MLLVYTYKITPRLSYIIRHIFTKMLLVEVEITTKVEDFIAHSGPKITYTRKPLQNEFFIKSNDLLFEQGISDLEMVLYDWEGIPAFFPTNDKSAIPYDIFAASFYFLSRYEEYLPHVKDEHGRFPAEESLAMKHDFLDLPLVDIWVARFKIALQRRFPDMVFGSREFRHTSIIDVPVITKYLKRGIIRTMGGIGSEFLSLKFGLIWQRLMVLMRFKNDPYDIFEKLTLLHKTNQVEALYFFLIADYSTYDKNISFNNPSFKVLVKSVADYSVVSLMASYKGFTDLGILKKERKRLISYINRPVKRVRQRFNRLNLPDTYRLMVEAEFNEDYTMGYTSHLGFRASTCTPFFFYDISFEEQIPLRVNPICIHYAALENEPSLKRARERVFEIENIVKKVHGTFNTVFSNNVINFDHYNPVTELYLSLIDKTQR